MDRNERERNDSFPHGYEPLIGRQAEAAAAAEAADDRSFGGKKNLQGGGVGGRKTGKKFWPLDGMRDGAIRRDKRKRGRNVSRPPTQPNPIPNEEEPPGWECYRCAATAHFIGEAARNCNEQGGKEQRCLSIRPAVVGLAADLQKDQI